MFANQSQAHVKGISDSKAHMDYCEDPARGCENLNFCFPAKKSCSTLTEKPCVVSLNFFERWLDFFQQHVIFKTNGRENSNIHNFLPDLHNNPSRSPWDINEIS